MANGPTPIAIERETCLLYNEEEKTASITTFNRALIRRLNKICETNHSFRLVATYSCGKYTEYEYEIPKRYITVKIPREVSEERKAKFVARVHPKKTA